MAGKFVLSKRKNGEFQFVLKSTNGQVILVSEGYKAKPSARNGIESVRRNSQSDARFDRKVSKNGKFFFNLVATNGQVVGTSELYESERSRETGIASVTRNAPAASLVDETVS